MRLTGTNFVCALQTHHLPSLGNGDPARVWSPSAVMKPAAERCGASISDDGWYGNSSIICSASKGGGAIAILSVRGGGGNNPIQNLALKGSLPLPLSLPRRRLTAFCCPPLENANDEFGALISRKGREWKQNCPIEMFSLLRPQKQTVSKTEFSSDGSQTTS